MKQSLLFIALTFSWLASAVQKPPNCQSLQKKGAQVVADCYYQIAVAKEQCQDAKKEAEQKAKRAALDGDLQTKIEQFKEEMVSNCDKADEQAPTADAQATIKELVESGKVLIDRHLASAGGDEAK